MGKGSGDDCRAPMALDMAVAGAPETQTETLFDMPATPQAQGVDRVGEAIRASLTDDLLKPEYRGAARPFTGHCYVASEAYYHLMGGKEAGYKPVGIEHEGSQHWWLEDKDGKVIDLTAEQFQTPVPYHLGKGRGFLTRQPSKRAQKVIARVKAQLGEDPASAARPPSQWKVNAQGRRYRHEVQGGEHTITCEDGYVVRYRRANRPGCFLEQRVANPRYPQAVDSGWHQVMDVDVAWPEVLAGHRDSSG